MEEIETHNRSMVGKVGEGFVIMRPPRGVFSKEVALNLAAYIVILSGVTRQEFGLILDLIENA